MCRFDFDSNSLGHLTESVEQHYDRLQWLVDTRSSDFQRPEADWFFEHLHTRITLLELYQHYFPKQWHNSEADTRLLDLAVHTPRELEFFDLVDEHHFPCDTGDIDFRDSLVAYSLAPEWQETEWSELDCLVQCCLGLTNDYPWQSVLETYGLQDAGMEVPAPPAKTTPEYLKKACATVTSPLKALSRAFELIECCTENLWLQSSYVEPEALEWSRDNIELLTTSYKEAKGWLQAFNDLNDWLYTNPERLRDLVALWNSAQSDPNVVQLEIPFVTTISSHEFVAGLTGRRLQESRENAQYYGQLMHG